MGDDRRVQLQDVDASALVSEVSDRLARAEDDRVSLDSALHDLVRYARTGTLWCEDLGSEESARQADRYLEVVARRLFAGPLADSPARALEEALAREPEESPSALAVVLLAAMGRIKLARRRALLPREVAALSGITPRHARRTMGERFAGRRARQYLYARGVAGVTRGDIEP